MEEDDNIDYFGSFMNNNTTNNYYLKPLTQKFNIKSNIIRLSQFAKIVPIQNFIESDKINSQYDFCCILNLNNSITIWWKFKDFSNELNNWIEFH